MDSFNLFHMLTITNLPSNKYREQKRLDTFIHWHVDFKDKYELAMLGFYFWRFPDTVKCAFCDTTISAWEPCDDTLITHYQVSPECPLLNLRANKNVPLQPEKLDRVLLSASTDFCTGCDDTVVRINRTGQITEVHISTSLGAQLELPDCCIYPNFNNYKLRFGTYKFCGWNSMKTPQELCNAGFINTKIGDKVTCFCCGGSVSGWKADDCPWEVHAYRFSDCEFLKAVKGKKLIERAKEKFNRNGRNNTPNQEAGSSSSNTSSSVSDQLPGSNTTSTENVSQDSKTCKICFDNAYNMVFIPCGHILACSSCASKVTSCPTCRKPVTSRMKVYLS